MVAAELTCRQVWNRLDRLLNSKLRRYAVVAFGTITVLANGAPGIAQAQDPTPVVGTAMLPLDLTPWGMYLDADPVVKAVLIGLARRVDGHLDRLADQDRGHRVVASADRCSPCASLGLRLRSPKLRSAWAIRAVRSGTFWMRQQPSRKLSAGSSSAEGIKERVASRLERMEAACARRIARGIGVLATIGATAPFVGLFGTVWGIMDSFIGISQARTTNLAVVAPGIAEALLATALGLVAAIPAVVIYNAFARMVAGYRAQLGDASAEVFRLVSRDLERTAAATPGATATPLSAVG